MDFTLEVFYTDFVESGNPGKEPFVLRTQDQLEMFKKSDCKSLSVRVMQRVVTYEKHSVNIFDCTSKNSTRRSALEQKNKDICIEICGTRNGICGKNWTGNWDLGNIWPGKWDLDPPFQDPLRPHL